MSSNPADPRIAILFAVVVLGATALGFVGGYIVRGEGAQVAPVIHRHAAAPVCPYELDPTDVGVLAGFACPGETCERGALADCHCDTAHGIKTVVKSLLARGRNVKEIQAEIEGLVGQ